MAGEEDFPIDGGWDARRAWFATRLEGRPREDCILIAARAALRALPELGLMLSGKNPQRVTAGQFAKIILPACRANVVSLAASLAPASESKRFVVAAADAAASASAYAPEDASNAAAFAASAFADAAFAAFASASAASALASAAAASAAAAAFLADLERLDGTVKARRALALRRLWHAGTPPYYIGLWEQFSDALRSQGDGWDIWADWYGGGVWKRTRFPGLLEGAPDRGPSLFGLSHEKALQVLHDVALIDNTIWEHGPAILNAEFRRIVEAARGAGEKRASGANPSRADIAALASPQPRIDERGRLDAIAHPEIDKPVADDDLPSVPIRQIAAVQRLLAGMPRNAPPHLKVALDQYREELIARGVQPILSLLEDAAQVIRDTIRADEAGWAPAGIDTDLAKFGELHAKLLAHFPLNIERETAFSQVPYDENTQSGRDFVRPFEAAQEAIRQGHAAGLASDNAVTVIEKMTEFARVLSTMPLRPPEPGLAQEAPGDLFIRPEDRPTPVSPKKRAAISLFGFTERGYNFLGSTASIASTPQGQALIARLGEVAINAGKALGF
jgi:hypothetical protein